MNLKGLDGSLSEQGQTVLQSMAAGQITPRDANSVIQSMGTLARVEELEHLSERVEALERVLQSRRKPK